MKYALIALFAVLAYILLWPVRFDFFANDGNMTGKLKIYFLNIELFGNKKEKDTQKDKKPAPSKKSQSEATKKPAEKKSSVTLDTIISLIKSVFAGLEFLSRKLHFDRVVIDLTVGKEEPDETAVFFGQINAAVYTALGVLGTYFKIDYDNVQVRPDFENRCFLYKIGFSFWALPVTILVTAIVAGVKFIVLNPTFFTKNKK